MVPGESSEVTTEETGVGGAGGAGGAATREAPAPVLPRARVLPPWRVLLHDDDINEMEYVADSIERLTPLRRGEAWDRMIEAHRSGLALLLMTHREHAELLEEQFTSLRLTVTIEPAD